MPTRSNLRPVTGAEVVVVPWRDRAAVLSESGRRPATVLRPVDGRAPGPDEFADSDLVLALRIGHGPEGCHAVVGSVVVAERARYLAVPAQVGGRTAPRLERLMVIDRLWLSEPMMGWRPPLGALLVATAAMVVATVAHDGSARTCVACRVEPGDEVSAGAAAALGAPQPVPGPSGAGSRMWPGVAHLDDLKFLDHMVASVAARTVIEHLDSASVPSRPLPLGDVDGRGVEAMMSRGAPAAIATMARHVGLR